MTRNTPTTTTDLATAHDEAVARTKAIPNAALDWQPGDGAWSLRRVLGHLAHANDFYLMIVEEAHAGGFTTVRLDRDRDLPGWPRLRETDAAVAACDGVPAILACFEATYARMQEILADLAPGDLDRPITLHESAAEPSTTTLRRRVLAICADHLYEHRRQISDTLARWRADTAGERAQEGGV